MIPRKLQYLASRGRPVILVSLLTIVSLIREKDTIYKVKAGDACGGMTRITNFPCR